MDIRIRRIRKSNRLNRNIHRCEPPVKVTLSIVQGEMGCLGEIEVVRSSAAKRFFPPKKQ
jgi:hypothetical protein